MNRESDGERAVRVALEDAGIKFEQEKDISFLKGDSKTTRRADFYLPKFNVYVEFAGGWDKPDLHEREIERARYNEKKRAYENNDVQCIWIYPSQLHYVSKVIKEGLEKYRGKTEPLEFYKSPLGISVFAGVLLLVLTVVYHPLLFVLVIDILLIIIFAVIKCPNCHRIFGRMHVSRDFLRQETQYWEYRYETKYLYSDGSYKNSTYTDWKKRPERIKIFRSVKECKYCGHKWTVNDEENIDAHSRPQTVRTYRTNYRNPANRQRYRSNS